MTEENAIELTQTCERIADNLDRIAVLLAALVVLSNKGHISGGIYNPELIQEAQELARSFTND